MRCVLEGLCAINVTLLRACIYTWWSARLTASLLIRLIMHFYNRPSFLMNRGSPYSCLFLIFSLRTIGKVFTANTVTPPPPISSFFFVTSLHLHNCGNTTEATSLLQQFIKILEESCVFVLFFISTPEPPKQEIHWIFDYLQNENLSPQRIVYGRHGVAQGTEEAGDLLPLMLAGSALFDHPPLFDRWRLDKARALLHPLCRHDVPRRLFVWRAVYCDLQAGVVNGVDCCLSFSV